MPRAATLYVNPQPAQENQIPNSYNTRAVFFVAGSEAAVSEAKRIKKTLAPLAESTQTFEAPLQGSSFLNLGLATPQTPSNGLAAPIDNAHHYAHYPSFPEDVEEFENNNYRYQLKYAYSYISFFTLLIFSALVVLIRPRALIFFSRRLQLFFSLPFTMYSSSLPITAIRMSNKLQKTHFEAPTIWIMTYQKSSTTISPR
jgi:hypothetical protein